MRAAQAARPWREYPAAPRDGRSNRQSHAVCDALRGGDGLSRRRAGGGRRTGGGPVALTRTYRARIGGRRAGGADPAPQGKTVGKVFVVNQNVFSKRDWYFQLFNIFHWTTRSHIMERELLLKPGQPYDQLLVEESTRNLQNPPGKKIAPRMG